MNMADQLKLFSGTRVWGSCV